MGKWVVLWLVICAVATVLCVELRPSESQAPAPDGTYWQAQAETLFQSRQSCEQVQIQLRLQLTEARERAEALQQRVKALEEAKPAE